MFLKKQRVKLKRVEWDEIKRFINREIQAKRDHKMIKNRKQSLDIDEQIAIQKKSVTSFLLGKRAGALEDHTNPEQANNEADVLNDGQDF